MTLEQRAHDIGLAFATSKMNSRDNTSDDNISRQAQFLNFITDYTFAASEIISGSVEIDTLFKDWATMSFVLSITSKSSL